MTAGACGDRAQVLGSGLLVTATNGFSVRGRRGKGAGAESSGARLSLLAGERSKGLG